MRYLVVHAQKSRAIRSVGEVFRAKLTDGRYVYGIVLMNNVNPDPGTADAKVTPGTYYVYIYNYLSARDLDVASQLQLVKRTPWLRACLNGTGWRSGYFETIAIVDVNVVARVSDVFYCANYTGSPPVAFFCDPTGMKIEGDFDRSSVPELGVGSYGALDLAVERMLVSNDFVSQLVMR